MNKMQEEKPAALFFIRFLPYTLDPVP